MCPRIAREMKYGEIKRNEGREYKERESLRDINVDSVETM